MRGKTEEDFGIFRSFNKRPFSGTLNIRLTLIVDYTMLTMLSMKF